MTRNFSRDNCTSCLSFTPSLSLIVSLSLSLCASHFAISRQFAVYFSTQFVLSRLEVGDVHETKPQNFINCHSERGRENEREREEQSEREADRVCVASAINCLKRNLKRATR